MDTTMTATAASTAQQDAAPPTAVDPEEEEKLNKAIKFWNHPSLQNVSSEEKRAYLHGQGLSDAQIHKAWEKMINEGDSAKAAVQSSSAQPSAPAVPSQPSGRGPVHNPQNYQQQAHNNYPPHHQPQSHYNFPYPYPSHSMEDDDDGTITMAKGVSLVAVGGLVGLTAAAAVRWLNGGDFQLLPPPVDGALAKQQQRQQEERDIIDGEYYDGVQYAENEDEVDYEYEDDDEEYVDTLEVQQRLFEKMEELSEAVANNTSTQEKLMVKMSHSSSSITNQSMNLLRNSQTPKNNLDISSLSRQLTEVKEELSAFTQNAAGTANGNRQELEEESAKLLDKLQSCLDMLSVVSPDTANGDSSMESPTKSNLETTNELPPLTPGETTKQPVQSDNSITTPISLHECIRQIAESNDGASLKVGTQLLYLYLVNLSGKPENARYRKIYTSNQSFQKVESLIGGKALLQAVGFVADDDKSLLEWIPSGSLEEETAALVLVKEAAAALSILKSGKPGEELTELALSKLSPSQETGVDEVNGENEQDLNESDAAQSSLQQAPQTPAGSMLVSPPMTKKLPFPEQPSATPTNLSDRLEKLPMEDEEEEQRIK